MSAWASRNRADGRDVAGHVRPLFGVRHSVFDPPLLGSVEERVFWPLFFIGATLQRFRLARHPVFRRLALRLVAGGCS